MADQLPKLVDQFLKDGDTIEQLRARIAQQSMLIDDIQADNQRLRADAERSADDRHRLVNAIFSNVDRETYGAIMRAENPSAIDAARSK